MLCRATVDETVSALGGLDGLVLNVGIAAGRRLAETTAEQWDYTFAVNLRSHFLLCQVLVWAQFWRVPNTFRSMSCGHKKTRRSGF